MDDAELVKIGEWLNTRGYCIDLSDQLWMEDWVQEHSWRDIAELMFDYNKAMEAAK